MGRVTTFLMILFCLSQVSLTCSQEQTTVQPADNMCLKTVRESVPVVVTEVQTVSVRHTKKCGFLWMKTCSSYKMDIRTVSRTSYQVKELTISVCCNGTTATGGCVNKPITCNIPGKYGPHCDQNCSCDVNHTLPEICDDVTGYCFCLDGYDGPGCSRGVNSTDDSDYDSLVNGTDVVDAASTRREIAGGGDVITRAIIAVIVVSIILLAVLVVFCCWRRRLRRKDTSGGTTVSDDFVVSLNPTTSTVQIHQDNDPTIVQSDQGLPSPGANYYVTPEEVRRCKKEQEAFAPQETQEKPYDYVEMRTVSGAKSSPTTSETVDQPSFSSSFTSSMSRRALEKEAEAGRQSFAYVNLPSPTGAPVTTVEDTDTSHYYMGDTDRALPSLPSSPASPTYSLMRRQESGDSVFDDDGYCTSPTTDDPNLQYSVPRYTKDKRASDMKDDSKTENIYDCLNNCAASIPVPVRHNKPSMAPPQYANISDSITPSELPYDEIPYRTSDGSTDGYASVV